jgi:hypothetical protein
MSTTLTMVGVAEELEVSPTTVRRLANRGVRGIRKLRGKDSNLDT